MKDDIRNLYDALVKNGYSIDDLGGSEDNFRANMRDEKIRGEFYDWVVGRDDFNIGSRDAYERRMTGALGSPTANAAPQQDNARTMSATWDAPIELTPGVSIGGLSQYNSNKVEVVDDGVFGKPMYAPKEETPAPVMQGIDVDALNKATQQRLNAAKSLYDYNAYSNAAVKRGEIPTAHSFEVNQLPRERAFEAEQFAKAAKDYDLLDGTGEIKTFSAHKVVDGEAVKVNKIDAPGQYEVNGKIIYVSPNALHSPEVAGLNEALKYADMTEEAGFWETIAQGFENQLYGNVAFTGEALKLFDGDKLHAERLLSEWDKHFEDGAPVMRKTGSYGNSTLADEVDYNYLKTLYEENGRDVNKVRAIVEKEANSEGIGDALVDWATEGYNSQKPSMSGFGGFVAELIPNMTGQVAAMAAASAHPVAGAVVRGIDMGIMSGTSAGLSMIEARNSGATTGETWGAGLIDGAIELVTEKIPYDMAMKRVMRPRIAKQSAKLATEIANNPTAKKEMATLLTRANKELGGKLFSGKNVKDYMSIVAAEGMSEFTAEGLQTMTPMIYKNPEDYPTLSEIINNGVKGALGGLFMGAVLGGAAKGIQHKADNNRRRKQGGVIVASVTLPNGKSAIGEVLSKVDDNTFAVQVGSEVVNIAQDKIGQRYSFTYNEFKDLELRYTRERALLDPLSGNTSKESLDNLDASEKRLRESAGIADDVAIDKWIEDNSTTELSDEVVADLEEYMLAKERLTGLKINFLDKRDAQYRESDAAIDDIANDDGNIYRADIDGSPVTIVGDIQLTNDGNIDYTRSGNMYYTTADGVTKPLRTGEIAGPIKVENAEERKAAGRVAIDERWMAEFDSAETSAEEQEKREKGVVFDMTDPEGTHRVEIVSEGEEMSDILLDGAQMEIPTGELNRWKQEAGMQTESGEVKGENGVQPEVAPAQTELPKEKQAVVSIPTEKRGKEERAAYHMVPIERTMEDLHDGTLEPDEIVGLIDARIKEAENDVKTVEKKKPVIGADKNAYVAAKQQWQADMEAARAKLDYYNNLKAVNAEVTRSEMREAVEGVVPQTLIEQTADEFVANQLGNFVKITPESFQKETGLKAEQKQMVGVIAGKDKGGVSVERAAELIMENFGDELRGLGFNGDMQDMRDTIIGILSNGNPRSYAKKGAEMRAQESVDEQMSQLESIAIGMGFKDADEMIAYEETVVPRIIQDYTGFDEQEYFNNLAENYEYDTTRESEGTRGGSELLQGEQVADNTGDANLGEPGQGGEVQGDVYSSGENAASQGNQQVNEPVGNSEQLSSSEIPNNQSVAEGGNAPGQSGVEEIQKPRSVEEVLENGDKRITNYNSRGEVATVATERNGKVVSVDSYDEGVLFEHTEYDENGVSTSVTRYDKQGNAIGTQVFVDGKAVPEWLNKVPDDGRYFFVYVKFAGENKYQAIDLGKGETVDRLVRATMLQKEQLQALVEKLPSVLLEDAEFQIRDAKGNIYYNSGKVVAENEVAKQENKPVENEPIKDEAPVTSETTEQPETGEVANAGPVNRETLQLNMSEEDFNALLNSGDKAAISEYLAEMDGLLRIGAGSPLDGRDAIVKEYRGLVEQYGGEENIPADVVAGFDERIAPYNALQRAVFDRKYALQDKLREIEANEAQAKELAEKEAKAEHKQTAFGGFLAGKSDVGASTAEKALSKKYNFDGKVMTVAEFVEEAVANGNVKLSAIEEPKYKGASRAAWNRMDARQQEADAKRVKESGTKTVYTVNDHDLGKTAYDYAKFLLDKKAEQEKAAAKQKVKDAIEPFAKEKAAEQATIKIEDVGEKIGGARKDIIRQYADKIKLDGKTFSTMFPKPDIDKLVEAGLPKDKVAAVKAMYDNAKREFEIVKKRRGKDKALQASLFYAMYAKNVLTGEEGNFDLAYNGFVFTEWGKEFMKANIALYKAVFNKLGTDYGKVDLRSYFISPLAAGMREYFNLKKLNEENSRMQQRMAEMDGRKVPEYKDGDVINFVGEHYSRPSDQFETLEEAVNTMVERISKEVKVDEAAQYKVESYWKRDAQGRADYTKAYLGIKVRGFGTVDVMEFKNMNEANTWLQNHKEDFQQMAAAKEEQVKAENKKPLPKYVLGHSYNEAQSQYSVFADFGKEGVKILKTFNIPQAEGVAAQAKARSEVYKNDVLPYINSEEAVQSADGIAQEIRDAKDAKPKSITIEKKSRERVGVDWRNGKDATPEMFVDVEGKEPSVFGFRAIEFGNYVSQKERQQFLNDIYDALMDMSEILGVSPRALSLGGKLALAVGARGTSGASGHYEPYKNVINITKTRGAGVLAHEWLHAFDRYFSNFDENAVYPNGVMYATQGMFADDTRKEVKEAFDKVMTAIKGGDYEKRSMRLGEYWASDKELAARALQDYIIRKLDDRGQKNDFLSNHVAPEEWDGDAKGYPFPLGVDAKRIADAFDNLFATLEEKTTEDGKVVLYNIADEMQMLKDKGSEAFERATKVTMEAVERLKANGLDIEVVSQEEADAMMELAEMENTEMMSVSEAKRRADTIESLSPISITKNTKTKEELNEDYKNLPKVNKEGKVIEFYNSAFKKIYKEGGLFAQIVPQLDDILRQSVFAYSENDNLGGVVRPDGTMHKAHPNISRFYNYVGKVKIDGKDYYVRTTVKEEMSGQTGTHSYMVTDVALYDNTTGSLSLPITTRARVTHSGIVDAKLKQFFDFANGKIKNPEFAIFGGNSGYVGYSMSKRAAEARAEGRFPKTDFKKEYGVTEKSFNALVEAGIINNREWHHTSMYGNKTTFYGWEEPVYAEYYKEHKKEIDKVVGEVEKFKPNKPSSDVSMEEYETYLRAWDDYAAKLKALESELKSEFDNALETENADRIDVLKAELAEINREINKTVRAAIPTTMVDTEFGEKVAFATADGYFVALPESVMYQPENAQLFAVGKLAGEGNGYLVDGYSDWAYDNRDAYDKVIAEYLNAYNKAVNSIPTEVAERKKEIERELTNRVEFLRTANGKVYGWAVNGTIYLMPDGINPNTPVHEYAHLWGADVEKNNLKLWNEVVEAMKLSPVWNEVANDANYSNIHGNDSRMASEVLARLSGRENYRRTMEEAQREIEQAKTIEEKAEKISRWAKVKAALKNFWNWVQRNVFRKKENATAKATTEVMPWEEFANSVVGDFYKGKNPNVNESPLERMAAGEDITPEMKEGGVINPKSNRNIENKDITLHKTKDGRIVRYEQLDLFNNDERAVTDIQRNTSKGNGNANNGAGAGDIQRGDYTGGNSLAQINVPLRPLEKGEMSLVQRIFTKSRAFDFTAGEQIESLEDVAYIFKNLEDESIENSFAVLVKDGMPMVLHLGMGGYTSTIINATAVAVAMENVKPDKVYFVHNHPSGALKASANDVEVLQKLRTNYGDIVEKGIIINLKSGKFGVYDVAQATSEVRDEKTGDGLEVPVEIFTFNKQVFDKDFNPSELFQIYNADDIAAFISSNRLGDRNKIGLLVCNNQLKVVGNVFTPYIGINSAAAQKIAKDVVYYTTVMGGNRPILFGRFPVLSRAAKSNLEFYINSYSGGQIKLVDLVDVESSESVLNEEGAFYGDITKGNAVERVNLGEPEGGSLFREGETLFSKKKLTPEQKKKQEDLKENAKAIRRLHNVKANFSLTALRNFGFALETQEQRDEHDRLFAERDAISGRENAVSVEVNPQSMTLMERITESLMKHAEKNKENIDMRLSAIRAYGRDLANVIKLMRAQRGYDRNTVNMFVSLAKMYLRNNAMSGMSSNDISRLLGLISRANGGYGPQVMRAAEQIAEIITKSHTKELEDIVRKQIKTGAEKVNASGVVVQGGVDIIGKRVLNTFRDAINMKSEEEFEKAYKEAFERAAKFPNDAEAKAVCDAMVIAKEYRDNIADRKAQEKELQKSIGYYSDIRQRLENGEISRREYNEFVDSVRRSIVELRAQMVDDYQKIIHALGGDITEGIARAKAFRERELARIENIRNMADADMEGVSKSAERKKRGKMGKSVDYITYKNPLLRLIMTGMGTYNEFMKFFGRNAIGGKGRLYDYFIGRYTEAQNQEWKEKQADIKKMDDKCKEIFGKDFISVMRDSTKNSGVVLEYWNGGERVSRELSIGQLMYIYMTAKQTDGEMKLRGMGITEETVNRAVSVLPATYKAYADWVQSEFLPEMRPRMNKVHQRMFGASMSEVENYFPLVVNTDARQSEVDLNSVMPITPSTITGAVIKRKVNATPLDLEANAFDVLMNHVNDMEHWAAFAEFTRDNNTLISDKDFMNRVKNSKDLRYGDGEMIWNDFVDCARITTGNYQSKKDYMSNIMKGTNSAKITFGYYTALKQFLSAPGLLTDASWRSVIKATANPMGSWKWAIENLPGFEERWKGRTAGNERLADSDNDWSIWDNRVVKAARELGMSPNAFVDALVVSTGARAVYETRKKLYKSLGLPDADAHKRAQTDAAAAYNETQQSAQGAYLSILQKEGGFYAMVMTLFRNSQMAYGRKVTGSMAEIVKKISRWNDILENTEKKYKDMGLSEEDAHKAANREMLQSMKKDVINLVLFGYVLNAIWALGEYIPYLVFGDDEEEKKKIMGDILKIGATGMFEGFALGGFAKDLYIQGVTDSKYSVDMITTPFAEDFEKVYNRFKNDGTFAGLTQLLVLGAETTTGISPQRLIDDAAALIDFCEGDLDTATEVELLALRLAKVPQSQIDKIYMDEAIDGNVMKLAERFVEYKANRELFGIGVDKSKMADKYAKKFHKANKEDLEQIVQDENAFSGYYETLSPEDKARLAGMRRNYIKEQADVKEEEALTLEEKLQKILYGAKEQNLVYYEQSTTEDVDSEILIAIELSKYEDVYKEKEKLKGEEKAKFKKEHKKELDFYEDLKDNFNDISRYKSKMKESPEKAEYYMTKIRKEQTQAIELINDYNNE